MRWLVPGTRKTFSENLRKKRQGKGITIEQMAEKLGIAWGTVQRWEKGTNFPGPEEIDRMAEILGLTVPQLFARADPETDDTLELVNLMKNLVRKMASRSNL